MNPRYILVAILLAATLAAGIFVALRLQNPAAPEFALVLPAPNKVPAFSLVDQHGKPADQSVFQGQWDLVFFGFTHCPDICPTTLHLPRIVLVSVDPERDSPEIMAEYVSYFGDGNLGITGTLEEVSKLTSGLGIYFKKQPSDGNNYNVDHSAAVLLINPDGGFHALFSGPHIVDNYVNDLPIIMADN